MINSSRIYLNRANMEFARSVPAGSMVLDAGAGEQPYRSLFSHCRYEAADFEQVDKPYAKSTYVCDLAAIPVEDGRFDAVILNQVLEHLPEPGKVLRELRRVLKPGGRMICTAPLFYEEHEKPYDYYRYTQFAWHHLMTQAEFKIEKLEWLEGYLGTVAYQLDTAAKYLPKHPRDVAPGIIGVLLCPFLMFSKTLFRMMAKIYHRLDVRSKYTARGFPKNYIVIARKEDGKS